MSHEPEDIVVRLRAMQGLGDVQLKALMDGVGPQAAEEVERLRRIELAARNLVAQRGRHNTEIAYSRLVDALKS